MNAHPFRYEPRNPFDGDAVDRAVNKAVDAGQQCEEGECLLCLRDIEGEVAVVAGDCDVPVCLDCAREEERLAWERRLARKIVPKERKRAAAGTEKR